MALSIWFTFHYASTLSHWRTGAGSFPVRIYIPLCFYFIEYCYARRIAKRLFTFHYASTLSDTGITTSTLSSIYIPLCFYFIGVSSPFNASIKFIYIPLCFYFIRPFVPRGRLISSIYIPLCFYFINIFRKSLCLVFTFTFHYASTLSQTQESQTAPYLYIYIPLCFYFIQTRRPFQKALSFIYIPLCFYFINYGQIPIWHWQTNLHSIMLLLYLWQTRGRNPICYIYIPLCFYFIGCRKTELCTADTFTFHYASTLSCRVYPHKLRKTHLHSIMLLLYPAKLALNCWNCLIYIPLCFYFINFLFRLRNVLSLFTFHYASTLSKYLYHI